MTTIILCGESVGIALLLFYMGASCDDAEKPSKGKDNVVPFRRGKVKAFLSSPSRSLQTTLGIA